MIWLFTLACQEKQEDTFIVEEQEDTAQEESSEEESSYETTILQLVDGTPVQETFEIALIRAWRDGGFE